MKIEFEEIPCGTGEEIIRNFITLDTATIKFVMTNVIVSQHTAFAIGRLGISNKYLLGSTKNSGTGDDVLAKLKTAGLELVGFPFNFGSKIFVNPEAVRAVWPYGKGGLMSIVCPQSRIEFLDWTHAPVRKSDKGILAALRRVHWAPPDLRKH
ncbi:MAG: hypothetical protein HGA90_01030 [Alphaproteobacteria bacterium]|nr:hypothetical protein [Alphaproteobacteria bacterium]